MNGIEGALQRLAGVLGRLLDPVAALLDRLTFAIRHQLDGVGVPFGWQGPIVTGLWVVVLFLILRTVTGWLRIVFLVVVLLVLARVYGVLPAAVS